MTIAFLIKRILVMLFTKNPFRIKPFVFFIEKKFGSAVDIPEDLSYILLKETGKPFYYQSPHFFNLEACIENFIGHVPRFKYKGLFKEPDRFAYSMSNAHVIGSIGLVYNSSLRSFVEESGKEWTKPLKQSVYLNMITPPPVKLLPGLTISFLSNGADGGFYHFLFESLVKLDFYINLSNADHYLFNGPSTGWKLKWLDQTNIDQSKIIWVENKSHFKCEQLLFTNLLVNDQQISSWTIQSIKKLIPKNNIGTKDSAKIIWLTRKGIKLRNILWENQLLSSFPHITKVDFGSMDIRETLSILQNATHIISPHGAALSNVFMCNEATHILELYPDNETYKPCYARLSSVCKLKHNIAFINFTNEKHSKCGLDFLSRTISDFITN